MTKNRVIVIIALYLLGISVVVTAHLSGFLVQAQIPSDVASGITIDYAYYPSHEEDAPKLWIYRCDKLNIWIAATGSGNLVQIEPPYKPK
jgi:hypothetical protein